MSTHTFFSLCVPRPLATVQETNWDAQREKACVNAYDHASASQICLQNICGQQQNFPMAGPSFGSKSDPKTGPKQRPKRRNENVIQFWTHFGVHIWTQKWGQPSENFVAARKCFASRFATQQPEHECQHIPFSLCASQGRLLLYKKQIGTHREKEHVLTLTIMLDVANLLAKHLRAAAKFSDGWPHFWVQIWTPKRGPKQRPKRRIENVIQFWTPFWGPYLDPKMGSAIGEFRCCPQMFCKQICDPAA